MQLLKCENLGNYHFSLQFKEENFENINLKNLIASKIKQKALQTASVNSEWGCLEFENGLVDIEPKTLFEFCINQG